RHARSKRDWSSDVCSSDLQEADLQKEMKTISDYLGVITEEKGRMFIRNRFNFMRDIVVFKQMLIVLQAEYDLIEHLKSKMDKIEMISENQSFLVRSEERRVGKECFCGCWMDERSEKLR